MLSRVIQTGLCCFWVMSTAGKELPVTLRCQTSLCNFLKGEAQGMSESRCYYEALARGVELGRLLEGLSA
jgi:hypothetical protein